jgi:hypothetical protein
LESLIKWKIWNQNDFSLKKTTQGIAVQKNMKIKKEDLGRVRANKQYFNLDPIETTDTHGDCSKQQFSYQYLQEV